MWYQKLLESLAKKICPLDEINAILFIDQVIHLIVTKFYDGKPLPPLLALGLISDLHQFFFTGKPRDVSLAVFAKKCIGLILLHAKNSDDEAIYCSDFNFLLHDPLIRKALGMDLHSQELRTLYLSGGKINQRVLPLEFLTDINLFLLNSLALTEVINTDILKKLEGDCIKDMNYLVTVDVNQIVLLLNTFLNEFGNEEEILNNLYSYLLPYKNKSAHFDELILSVERYIKIFFNKHLSTVDHGFNHDDIKVNLMSTPLEPEKLVQFSLNIRKIIKLLDDYVGILEPGFSFFSKMIRLHQAEVREIVKLILAGSLRDIHSVLSEIKKIKILSREDQLVGIIADLEKESRDIVEEDWLENDLNRLSGS